MENIQWPEVFTNGKKEYIGNNNALADAYCGWALCYSGNIPPKKFGEGMVCIGEVLGVPPIEKNLDILYAQWRKNNG